MKDFIIDLYSNDNFTLWLTIALVILIVLFFIVLFFGKKDKKLQEMQKLAKVSDGFKEETKAEPVEVAVTPEEKVIEEIPEPTTEVTMDVVTPSETKAEENTNAKESTTELKEKPEEDFTIPEVKEIAFDEINDSLEKELSELENLKNEFNNIELPKADDVIKPVVAPEDPKPVEETKEVPQARPQVFSSVFVNKEEDDMELPTLKEEPKEEKVNETNFDLNNINGESYDLNDK